MKSEYPYLRVIIFFTLCPLLCGFVYGILGVGSVFLHKGGYSVSTGIGISLFLPVAGGFTGLLYFGAPAFLASIIYAVLRLYRVWYSFFIVTIVGGSAAQLWVPIIFSNKYVQWERTDMFGAFFLLGALSSLFMAYFILPRRPDEYPKELD